MAIEVTCPQGHTLRVKEKYAGKKGCCPRCYAEILVPALKPDFSEDEILEIVGPETSAAPASDTEPSDDHVHQDEAHVVGSDQEMSPSGMSLLNSSAVRHTKSCPKCGQRVPVWFASCSHCHNYFDE